MKFDDIEEEYKKNKDLCKEDVQALREWMVKQPHLPKISDFQIILFLHSCYYRVESTKTCIETFYTAKTNYPEFFKDRDPIQYRSQLLEVGLLTPLKLRTPAGYQIIFIKFLNLDPSKFIVADFVKSFDMAAMLMLHQEGTAAGHIILADLKGLTFGHVTRLTPTYLMKFFFYLQEALPFRLKALIFINIPSFMDKIMAIIKPFVKKELLNNFQLYTDKLDGLYATIPQKCLPKDYGGENGTIDELIEQRNRNFVQNRKFFLEDEKLKSDEFKRTDKTRNSGNVFGMDGTFKKLEID
ncbi:hypothetical protein Trydic_g23179 [Trypoxylus dichotomus]